MSPHEKHMQYVDAVNNSTTDWEHAIAEATLRGFRDGLEVGLGRSINLIACDMTQFERGHEERPMCCGVFLDWEPTE